MARRKKFSGKDSNGALFIIGLVFLAIAWKYIVPISIMSAIAFAIYKMANSKPSIQSPTVMNNNIFHDSKENVSVTFSFSTNGHDYNRKTESDPNAIFYDNTTKIQIGNYNFSPYLIYLSDKKTNLPHVVNRSLPVSSTNNNERLPYYPSFSQITPEGRATYLNWLSTDRTDPNVDIGYVFLYFYGLEFRAVFEDKNHLEIYKELIRLRNIYSSKNNSFNTYSNRLLYWLILKLPTHSDDVTSVLGNADRYRDLDIASYLIKLSDPNCNDYDFAFYLSKQVALRDYRGSIESFEKEFKDLFILKLKQEKKPKHLSTVRNRAYAYTSCSSVRFESRLPYQSYSLTSEKALANLWDECQFELKFYKKEKEAQNINAHFYLPPSLLESSTETAILNFKKHLPTEDFQVYDLKKLLSMAGIGEEEKIGMTISKKFTFLIKNFGFEIEPDPNITSKAFKADSKIIIFNKKSKLLAMDNSKYNKATLLLELGLSIAITSESVDQKEADHVFQFICKSLNLNALEKERLNLRLTLSLAEKKSTFSGLKKMASAMTKEESHAIAKFLFSIAMIDGSLEQNEVKALQKTFKSLGFTESTLDDLKNEHSQKTGQPILIKEASRNNKKGSVIPSQPSESRKLDNIELNSLALKEAFEDAEEVSRILATVFVEDNTLDQSVSEQTDKDEENIPLKNEIELTSAERDLLEFLILKTSWDCEEVETKCRELKMMYGSAINSINEWSEKMYDKSIIEEDGPEIIIHSDLMKTGVKSA